MGAKIVNLLENGKMKMKIARGQIIAPLRATFHFHLNKLYLCRN